MRETYNDLQRCECPYLWTERTDPAKVMYQGKYRKIRISPAHILNSNIIQMTIESTFQVSAAQITTPYQALRTIHMPRAVIHAKLPTNPTTFHSIPENPSPSPDTQSRSGLDCTVNMDI
jgi:hypothetical protein